MAQGSCSIEGCDKQRAKREWCRGHYRCFLTYGDPLGVPSVPTTQERFWAKVQLTVDCCWLWTAGVADGYGKFNYATGQLAHRYAYELLIGPIPDGLVIDHLCRVRHCVRPDHFELVTNRVNIVRGRAGEWQRNRTRCPRGHAYDESNTYVNPSGQRMCRSCMRAAWRAYRQRKRAQRGDA